MDPQNVNPGNFRLKKVIYTDPNGDFSVAIGEWVEDGEDRFAIRWNGDITNPNDLGYPSAFGNPMWFQLPDDLKGMIGALVQNCNSIMP